MSSAPVVLGLTRAASPLGEGLALRLAEHPHTEAVGLDAARGSARVVDLRECDLADPSVVTALEDVDVLIHLAWDHDLQTSLTEQPAVRRARMLTEARTLVTAAAAAGVPHLVLVSSTMIFGAREDNPVPLPEDSDLRAPEAEGLVADLVVTEEEFTRVAALHPGLRVTRLRPSALVGPGVDTPVTRHFEAPRLLTVKGTRPRWSFCHVDDLASALHTVAVHDLPDQLTVSAGGALDQAQVEELSGMKRIEVAEGAAYAAADRLHRLGVIPVPATDLAYVSHPWVSEPARLLAAGWTPRHDDAACLSALLEGVRGHHAVMARRLRSRDAVSAAAAGAASAAVAVIATAALMRRRRVRA